MSRARILHLRASNFVGGPEQQLLRYAPLESGSEFELTLGTFVGPGEGSDFIRSIEDAGLRSLSIPANGLATSFLALVNAVREFHFDLICAHGYRADILGILAGRLTGTPVACFLRGWTAENPKVRMFEALDRFFLRFANRIVCLSESQVRKVSRSIAPADKISVVRNAIDVAPRDELSKLQSFKEVRNRFGLPPDCVVVATGGRLSPEKGVEDFLEACSTVNREFPEVRFLVFGDGVLRKHLEHKAVALGIENRITFAGFLPELRSLLPGVNLVVNPSHSEEMPNIVLEAMAAEVPVVATAVGAVEEIAGSDPALCLAPPRNTAMLANHILQLLREPLRAQQLGSKGRDRVEQANSLSEQQSQFHALYRKLVGASQVNSSSKEVSRLLAPAHPVGTHSSAPFLSVVMPVRNEATHIEEVLAGLEAQTYPHDRFEVIVADGDSTDDTTKVITDFSKRTSLSIRQLRNPARLSSSGRNVGARNARGEYVVFIDGHCHIPSRTMLWDAVELFDRTRADCLCRPQPLTMSDSTPLQAAIAHTRATFLGHGYGSDIYALDFEGFVDPRSSGALYRRSVFERIGYYDENFDACEDVEFNSRLLKAGLLSYFSPKLGVYYEPRKTLGRLWQQMIRYGRGRFRLIRKHPEAFSPSQVVPAGFLVWIVLAGIGSLISRPFAVCFLGSLIVYLSVLIGFSIALGLRYGWRHLLQAPGIYLVIHFGLAMGFLMEFGSESLRARARSKTLNGAVAHSANSKIASGLSLEKSPRRSERS
jgi:succinoglycan biosynthesis protein ExoA